MKATTVRVFLRACCDSDATVRGWLAREKTAFSRVEVGQARMGLAAFPAALAGPAQALFGRLPAHACPMTMPSRATSTASRVISPNPLISSTRSIWGQQPVQKPEAAARGCAASPPLLLRRPGFRAAVRHAEHARTQARDRSRSPPGSVALRRPVSTDEVSRIRSVQSYAALRALRRRGLVARVEEAAGGRRALWRITRQFFELFGLRHPAEIACTAPLAAVFGEES